MIFAYLFIAVAAVLNTAQSGCSGTLHKQMNHPILPGIVSYVAGLAALLAGLVVYGWMTKTSLPNLAQWRQLAATGPWWMWLGGVLGAFYILAMVNVSEKDRGGSVHGDLRHCKHYYVTCDGPLRSAWLQAAPCIYTSACRCRPDDRWVRTDRKVLIN